MAESFGNAPPAKLFTAVRRELFSFEAGVLRRSAARDGRGARCAGLPAAEAGLRGID